MTSTMTAVKSFPPPSMFAMPDLYPIEEDPGSGGGGSGGGGHPTSKRRSSASRINTAPSQVSPFPSYTASQNQSSRFQDKSLESFHTTLKRPKKLAGGSNGANGNASSSSSSSSTPPPPLSQTRELRLRTSSIGSSSSSSNNSSASLHSLESGSWVRNDVYAQSPTRAVYRPEWRQNQLFAALPSGVLEVILSWLKKLHLGAESDSCATCWMRDLCEIAVCSKRWYKVARVALYEDIQLVGPDSATHKKKFKQAQGNRMAMLRRTLRSNSDIAALVRSLKVPAAEPPINWTPSKGMSWLEQYEDRVAALIMACPHLERLNGPTPTYNHSFRRIFHALSTREHLKDMIWAIDPPPPPPSPVAQRSDPKHRGHSVPSVLDTEEEDAFLDHHRNWPCLTNLSIACQPGATLAPHTLLSRTLTCLPAIQHLHLHNLSASSFSDENLLDLPPLRSLVLSHVIGITSSGLSSFATRQNSSPLQHLELRHTPITALPALTRIFSHLSSLKSFALVQTFPPVMPETDSFILWMMPYLASCSIAKLHWDITSHPTTTNAADDILARSIQAGGFPQLTTLRTPNDPQGRFQALCRPVEQLSLPGDRFSNNHNHNHNLPPSQSYSAPPSPISPLHKSSTTMSLPSSILSPLPPSSSTGSNLQTARLAAQSRLQAAKDLPICQVHITTEDGNLADSFGMGGYLGTLGSNISYHLLPDEGATDAQSGLLDVVDLMGHGGETLGSGREGCTGRWNWREGGMADRKEKERWWHTERGRWRRIKLE